MPAAPSVDESAATIRRLLEADGYLLDPHTAVAVHVADEQRDRRGADGRPATAHPAKFPAAVESACGITPGAAGMAFGI